MKSSDVEYDEDEDLFANECSVNSVDHSGNVNKKNIAGADELDDTDKNSR